MSMKLMERWTEHRLQTHERPRTMYEYYVSGRGEFPWDMLRHDGAWPASSDDAHKMGLGFWSQNEAYKSVRSVKLHSYRPPTIGRWNSFLWSPGTENLESKESV